VDRLLDQGFLHDRAGHGSSNSRNGFTPKRLGTEVGDIDLVTPRDRSGSFEPRLVPKGERRLGGLSDMIISLYAGGMTIRDIQAHLESTLGTQLSHETISNITDAVAEEVKVWQARPLEPVYPRLSGSSKDTATPGPRCQPSLKKPALLSRPSTCTSQPKPQWYTRFGTPASAAMKRTCLCWNESGTAL
jgi:hypothetical protein